MKFVKNLSKLLIIYILVQWTPVTSYIKLTDDLQNNVTKCVANLYRKHKDTYTFLVSYVNDTVLDNRNLYSNYNGFTYFKEDKFKSAILSEKHQMFIMLIDNIQQFVELIEILSNSELWNSRGKFIVGYYGEEDFGEIFNVSWKYNIFNINIIARNISTVNVYTFFPYNNGLCGEYAYYEKINSCEEDILENEFPPKIPLDMHGCEFKAMGYEIVPYVMNISAPLDSPALAGLELTIIHNVVKSMNLTLNLIKNRYVHWGHKLLDGNFTMLYKSLQEREVDSVFGYFYGNATLLKDFDISFSYLDEFSAWWFPAASQMPQWKNLTNIFEKNLWFAIFGMLLINGIAWWVVGRNREPTDDFNDLTLCIMSSMYILLQGSVQDPKTWQLRLIVLTWLYTCVLIFTAHQCQLISILTTPLYEHQMKTLEELLESGQEFGSFPSIVSTLKYNDSISKQVLRKLISCPLTTECVNRTAFKKDFAVVKNIRQVEYLIPRMYSYQNGRSMLYNSGIVAFSTKNFCFTYRGLPFLDRMNFFLMTLLSNGLIDKWDKDTKFFISKEKSDSDSEPLSLDHLQGAFLILSSGLMLAFLVLNYELFKKKFCKCKK